MASYQGTTINPGTDAQIAAQVAAINAGQKNTPVTPVPTTPPPTTPSTTGTPTIPVTTLTTPPATPATPVPPATTTDSAGALGSLTATQQQFQSTLDQQAAAAKTNESSSLDAYLKASLNAPTQAGLTNDAYTKTVDPAQKELNDANNALTAEQVALRHQIAKIQASNPKGIGSEVAQAQIDQLTRDSVSKQADLAVVQLAKQGAYDSAKAIADRAVNAEFEAQQAHNDALKFSYEENKDLFNTADQRAFDVAQADRQSQLDEAKAKRMADYNEKIQENSPLYKAQVANQYSEIDARNAAATNENGTLNGKPQSSVQAQTQTFADRMSQASNIISELGSKFTGAGSLLGQTLPNVLKGADRQEYEQAQLNFLNSVLRQESGAAIGTSEYKKYAQQYFPQPGDSAAVVAQKAANMNTTINGFYRQANVARPVNAGDIVQGADGKQYQVGEDGSSLQPYGSTAKSSDINGTTPQI